VPIYRMELRDPVTKIWYSIHILIVIVVDFFKIRLIISLIQNIFLKYIYFYDLIYY
jgi:hypothetical protein